MVFDELLKGLHQAFCPFPKACALKLASINPVLTDNINRLLALLLEFHEKLAKLRIVQGLYCFLNQHDGSLLNLCLVRFLYSRIIQFRPLNMTVRINGSDKACAQSHTTPG